VRNGTIQTIWINRKSRYKVVDLVADGREEWLKGGDRVDTLCRGEVAEWLNAAVSKTVTSVIPASGVRIPPSPLFRATGLRFQASGVLRFVLQPDAYCLNG
jgi:hypothetical protein